MRSKEEILVDAEKRIAHLEYFEKHAMLKEAQRSDLKLIKELVALIDGPEKNCGDCSRRKFYQEGYQAAVRDMQGKE